MEATIEKVSKVSEQDKQLFKKVKKVHLSTLLPQHSFPTGITHAVVDEFKNVLNYCLLLDNDVRSFKAIMTLKQIIFVNFVEHFLCLLFQVFCFIFLVEN